MHIFTARDSDAVLITCRCELRQSRILLREPDCQETADQVESGTGIVGTAGFPPRFVCKTKEQKSQLCA